MLLFLYFLKRHALTERGVVFHYFNLPLYFLAVLAAVVNVVRLGGLEFNELILRHTWTLAKTGGSRNLDRYG